MAVVMDVEEAGVLDCFVQAGSELQRAQVAPEADAFTYAAIASHEGVTVKEEDLSSAKAVDVLELLRDATSAMDEAQVPTGSRILFITPTLKGVLDDYGLPNVSRSEIRLWPVFVSVLALRALFRCLAGHRLCAFV